MFWLLLEKDILFLYFCMLIFVFSLVVSNLSGLLNWCSLIIGGVVVRLFCYCIVMVISLLFLIVKWWIEFLCKFGFNVILLMRLVFNLMYDRLGVIVLIFSFLCVFGLVFMLLFVIVIVIWFGISRILCGLMLWVGMVLIFVKLLVIFYSFSWLVLVLLFCFDVISRLLLNMNILCLLKCILDGGFRCWVMCLLL